MGKNTTADILNGISDGLSTGMKIRKGMDDKRASAGKETEVTKKSIEGASTAAGAELNTDLGSGLGNMIVGQNGREASSFITPVSGYQRGTGD